MICNNRLNITLSIMNHLNVNTQLEFLINSPLEQFEVINIIGVTAPYTRISTTFR